MKVLIVEDELLMAKRLQKVLLEIEPDAQIISVLKGVRETVLWLKNNPEPDLILMDIELADGQSFDIFKEVDIQPPVIFTTAYDEHAIKAFKVNSIDYLLKPVKEDELRMAIKKFKNNSYKNSNNEIQAVLQQLKQMQLASSFRSRFLVKQGQKLLSIDITEVAYFYSENKVTFLCTHQNKKHIIDYVLDIIEKEVSPKDFFRANRQYIISNKCITGIHTWFNQKLKVEIKPEASQHIVISRDKANAFKEWMGE